MPELRFALFVKQLLALLTGVLLACFICSRLFSKICLGKPTRPPGTARRRSAHPMNNMCLYGDMPLWIMGQQRGTTICLNCACGYGPFEGLLHTSCAERKKEHPCEVTFCHW